MEDSRLRSYCLVFEMKSFSRAAEAAFVTQSAISHLIRNLEEELGAVLFIRQGGKVRPTPAGRLFYSHAKKIMGQYEEMKEEINDRVGKVAGPLRIGATPTIATYLLPQVFYGFSRQYPGVRTELLDMNSEKIVGDLLEGRIEIGFLEGESRNAGVSMEAIADDEIVLIASEENALTKMERPARRDLLAQSFILPEPGSSIRRLIEIVLKDIGIAPDKLKVSMILGNPELIVSMVRSGIGVSFVSRWSAFDALREGSIKGIAVPGKGVRRKFYLVTSGRELPTAAARAFREFVREYKFFTPFGL